MRLFTLFLSFFLFLPLCVQAQPRPCVNPKMTSLCVDACVICDINGFTGINNSGVQGQAPPGFCTMQVHHMQWIAFIAGTPNLTLAIDVFNCQLGRGLEMGIYRSLDCSSFTLMSNCDTDVDNNETGILRNTVPLVPGQYYYLVIDGNGDDVCNYKVRVVNGSTQVSPLPESGTITGPATACTDQTLRHALRFPKGATAFQWTLDGQLIGRDSAVMVTWKTPGDHTLCATASNACDTAPPVCRLIHVAPSVKTLVEKTVCRGSCLQAEDTTLCAAGLYSFHYNSWKGCDSTVQIQVKEVENVTTTLSLSICDGDSAVVGGKGYYRTGHYEIHLKSVGGCDSMVVLDLKTIVCNMKGNMETTPNRCAKEQKGAFRFRMTDGTPPLTYLWSRVGSLSPSGSGTLTDLNVFKEVAGLPSGTYFVSVSDQFGNQLILSKEIGEPEALQARIEHRVYSGFALRCANGKDGGATALAEGGTPPFQYLWSTGDTLPQVSGLSAGRYTLLLTDANGCTAQTTDTLQAPAPLLFAASFTQADCADENSGSIRGRARGGIRPYQWQLRGKTAPTTDSIFSKLSPGTYTLLLTDAHGCTTDTSAVLKKPLIPAVDAGDDLYIDLGETVVLNPRTVAAVIYRWTPAEGLSCSDCRNPDALPLRTTQWVLSATTTDGCTRSDSVTVWVREHRRVYVPNVFHPGDTGGRNSVFFISAGREVSKINYLRVYSRWGELVFSGNDALPNAPSQGWDGSWKGEDVGTGIFVWQAEVQFIDGVQTRYTGDVLLVR